LNDKLVNVSDRKLPLPPNIKEGIYKNRVSLFHDSHDIDEMVLDHDAKCVSTSDVALFYHIQAHRNFLLASPDALAKKSEYSGNQMNANITLSCTSY
jgi:hypothetical protein